MTWYFSAPLKFKQSFKKSIIIIHTSSLYFFQYSVFVTQGWNKTDEEIKVVIVLVKQTEICRAAAKRSSLSKHQQQIKLLL